MKQKLGGAYTLFSTLLILIFVLEFAAGISGYVLRNQTSDFLVRKLNETMHNYKPSNPNATSSILWDTIQTEFKCCGANNYLDWLSVPQLENQLPISCCGPQWGAIGSASCNDSSVTLYHDGCVYSFGVFVRDNMFAVASGALVLAFVQVIYFFNLTVCSNTSCLFFEWCAQSSNSICSFESSVVIDSVILLRQHSNLRSADAELQQHASEYLQLSIIASPDVLATVLEEMPSFPERESSIFAVLKKKKPGHVPENEIKEGKSPTPSSNHAAEVNNTSSISGDLLGLSTPPTTQPPSGNTGVLLDVLGDVYNLYICYIPG
ncbi:hypothetical protein FQA39_LY07959 [Lamprigera yunnana]|nr:hypothetical protein FQA39_LY07959 [Lamprigera yunnana]